MLTIIPKNQALQRWDTIPQEIRDAMTSDKNNDVLNRIYSALHIPDEKQKLVARTVSYVFTGFVHIEDLAKELEGSLAMNSQHARELADEINQKILSPYRDILEKIYTGKIEEPARPSLDSIRAPEQKPAVGPKPLETLAPVATPTLTIPTKPAPTPTISPKFAATPAALPFLGTRPAKLVVSPSPASTATPSAAKPTPAPAPFIMQMETKVRPVAQAPKFTMESLGKAVSMFGGKTGTPGAPAKLAQVEIGEMEKQKPSGVVSRYESAPRIIHYSSLSTPLPAEEKTPASGGPISFGTLQQGTLSTPKPSTLPIVSFSSTPKPPSAPIFPNTGGFIKTLITPKNDAGTPIPNEPPKK